MANDERHAVVGSRLAVTRPQRHEDYPLTEELAVQAAKAIEQHYRGLGYTGGTWALMAPGMYLGTDEGWALWSDAPVPGWPAEYCAAYDSDAVPAMLPHGVVATGLTRTVLMLTREGS